MSRSPEFVDKVSRLDAEVPVTLLEITHPQLAVPIRIVDDNSDLVSNGETFQAFGFDVVLPDDVANQLPRARLAVDNVGRELTQWIDTSRGGKGAQVRVMEVLRSDPDTVEADFTLDLLNVAQNALQVTGQLGYENTLARPAIPATYRPETAPGLF